MSLLWFQSVHITEVPLYVQLQYSILIWELLHSEWVSSIASEGRVGAHRWYIYSAAGNTHHAILVSQGITILKSVTIIGLSFVNPLASVTNCCTCVFLFMEVPYIGSACNTSRFCWRDVGLSWHNWNWARSSTCMTITWSGTLLLHHQHAKVYNTTPYPARSRFKGTTMLTESISHTPASLVSAITSSYYML